MTQLPSALTMLFSRHTKRREFIKLLGGALSIGLRGALQVLAIALPPSELIGVAETARAP